MAKGDAAYAPTPLTGMGTSLAILGAYLLAGEPSELQAHAGQHPGLAFMAYEQQFRKHIEKIQNIPWFVPGVAHPKTAFTRWLTQTII